MPLAFFLLRDGQAVTLPDPAGSTFNAAGGFDRLLPLETETPIAHDPPLQVLCRVEAYDDVEFTSADMPVIAAEAARLCDLAKPGPELNGLRRLKVMAEYAQRAPDKIIRVLGD